MELENHDDIVDLMGQVLKDKSKKVSESGKKKMRKTKNRNKLMKKDP